MIHDLMILHQNMRLICLMRPRPDHGGQTSIHDIPRICTRMNAVIHAALLPQNCLLPHNCQQRKTENKILGQFSMQDKPPPQSRSPSRISTSVKCLPPGHFTGECPSVSPPNSPGRIRCLKCQDYGHVQRDCPASETSIVFPNDPGLGH